MASIPGRGAGGLGTSGPENTKSVLMRPDISGSEFGNYKLKNNGIKIRFTSSKKKSKIIGPKIV